MPSITLTSPESLVLYRLDTTGDTKATVTVAGTYADGTPTAIEYRVDGGSWLTLDAAPSGGTFSEDIEFDPGQGTLEVRWSNSTGTTDSVANFSRGYKILCIGQSNLVGRGDFPHTASGTTPIQIDSSGNYTSYPAEAAGSGSIRPDLATLIAAQTGAAVAFLTNAAGGTGLVDAQWRDRLSPNKASETVTQISNAGGDFSSVLWDQGESDVALSTSLNILSTSSRYTAQLLELRDQLSTAATALGPFVVAMTGTVPGYTVGTSDGNLLDGIREGQRRAWIQEGMAPGPVGIWRKTVHYGEETYDGNYELAKIAALWWVAWSDAMGLTTHGTGPRLVVAMASGSEVLLRFHRNLSTDSLFYPAQIFQIDNDDGAAREVLTAKRLGSRHILLKLDGDLDGTAPAISIGRADSCASCDIPESEAISLPTTLTWAGGSLASVKLPFVPCYARPVESVTFAEIAGATSATYNIASADLENEVFCEVTAVSANDSEVQKSEPSGLVSPGVVYGYGGIVTETGGRRIHTFPSNFSGAFFELANGGNVDILRVYGGGGGGGNNSAGGNGGGGGGRVIYSTSVALGVGSYLVEVGEGGLGITSTMDQSENGLASYFQSLETTGRGGGKGAVNGLAGGTGSSGGGGAGNASSSGAGGIGTHGNNGGNGYADATLNNRAGGGGGGAGAAGGNAALKTGGAGGSGLSNSITGSAVLYGAGGGGGTTSLAFGGVVGAGGAGGGGAGGLNSAGGNATGYGNGGGGSFRAFDGGNGSDGVVIISYAI